MVTIVLRSQAISCSPRPALGARSWPLITSRRDHQMPLDRALLHCCTKIWHVRIRKRPPEALIPVLHSHIECGMTISHSNQALGCVPLGYVH